MAETMEELSTVRVKDLISAYESKASATPVVYSRPRAKSLGNVLSKNVVVKENEVTTLEDVEKAQNEFQVNLSYYSVYNKQKHVELQNQLFNILTSIGNVRSESEDDVMMRKYLTAITLSMVSTLNQKLPSNTASSEQNAFQYTTYATFKKQNEENERQQGREHQFVPKQILPTYKPSSSEVDESVISVKKLKERYQSQNRQNVMTYNDNTEYKTEHSLSVKNTVHEKQMFTKTSASFTEIDGKYSEDESSYLEKNENMKDLSVLKLRMLFEKKTKEGSQGLQVVLNENEPQSGRFKFKVNTSYIKKQEHDKSFSTISDGNADQGDMSTDDHVVENMNESNYATDDNADQGDISTDDHVVRSMNESNYVTNDNAVQGDMSTIYHVVESMNESNYATANNSINGFEENSDRHDESDSDPSSTESTGSAIEIK